MIGNFNKRYILLTVLVWLIVIAVVLFVVYSPELYDEFTKLFNTNKVNVYEETLTPDVPISPDIDNVISIPSVGNDFVYQTTSKATIRVINEYDESIFKGKKTVLLIWSSWCNSCQKELTELEKITNYYKKSDIQIVLVSHNYDIDSLVEFLESGEVNYNSEILLDLGRIIRKNIDPTAYTIPVSYVLDPEINILYKYDGPVTLELVQEWCEQYLPNQ